MVYVRMDIRRGGIGKEREGGIKRGRDRICILYIDEVIK